MSDPIEREENERAAAMEAAHEADYECEVAHATACEENAS